jgi:eukaryotic-like serine/threonine-protein kinase
MTTLNSRNSSAAAKAARLSSGDIGKAKTAYKDFPTLWKDADPDIPIVKQANVEYAKLQ